MKREEKLLLIKDLCARLPYGVWVQHTNTQISGMLHDIISYPLYDKNGTIYDIDVTTNFFGEGDYVYLEYFKPYLFPMSSMTEEQKSEYHDNCNIGLNRQGNEVYYDCDESIDWLNSHHFDYRGLISMGLAIDVTELNIY